MKTNDMRNLQALRQLREQRASSQLAAQQQRCRETHVALDDAKEKLRLHREALAREAERIYGLIGAGVSISNWHAAQEHLEVLYEGGQRQLEVSVSEMARTLAVHEQTREVFRVAHAARQRQAQACDTLLDDRERLERRVDEHRLEADEIPRVATGGRT
ncbi:YscO family type III secretion system apparatus protein [Pseudomonas sp. SWRI196]|uniref:YscO family type III secretion system apparatus protein n=1 Tax=Pseudomonas tehranensis TaxID=2745502 RepID=A0ABR6UPA6_9PSED|nr:YscO family type III secretion system apparatus protein [Pseudomonas tehranensis]MBC3346035.1 YscO family type III secretion system apparatus protein [Pseudomonas tehranensis]